MADAIRFDETALDRLRRFGGDKLVRSMSAVFLEHVPARLDAARGGLEARDPEPVRDALHALKSSAAQLGAQRMSALCAEGEAIARGGSLERIPELLDTLDAELAATREWLAAAVEAS